MKKTKQLHSRSDVLSPRQTVQFLDDFSLVVHGQDQKSKLISIRIPENILNTFKIKAKTQNKKYQSVIVQLMREWVKNND